MTEMRAITAFEARILGHFANPAYDNHNRRRQEHLASLDLPIPGASVLELGAGVGDHSCFFLARNCPVTAVEARPELTAYLRERYPAATVVEADLEAGIPAEIPQHDVVYAFGLFYHLADPEPLIQDAGRRARRMMIVETCLSTGTDVALNPRPEPASDPTQAFSGMGSRPTRAWMFEALRRAFPHVYMTRTQPWLHEFPIDWTRAYDHETRAVFVAAHEPIDNPLLSATILDRQTRCP